MSSYEFDFSSHEISSTDEEYEKQQEELESEYIFNSASNYFYDVMYQKNIRSPYGPLDGATINACLQSTLKINDVVKLGRLKYSDKTALGEYISEDRIQDFREAAKAMVVAYLPEMQKQASFINSVAAYLIKYHFRL
jgi:hypothetical protein